MYQNTHDVSTDLALLFETVEPIIRATRGKHPDEKTRVLRTCSEPLRAAFLMQVLIGHMQDGTKAFFAHIAYLAEHMDFWGALKSAARFFDDAALIRLLEQMQSLHSAETCSTEQAQLSGIDAAYQLALPQTLSKITDFIKAHPETFEIPDQYK